MHLTSGPSVNVGRVENGDEVVISYAVVPLQSKNCNKFMLIEAKSL